MVERDDMIAHYPAYDDQSNGYESNGDDCIRDIIEEDSSDSFNTC